MEPDRLAPARDEDIRRILALARSVSGMDVAWISRFDTDSQVLTHVSAPAGAVAQPGYSGALEGSFCLRVVDGSLPGTIPDVAADPRACTLPVADALNIAAYAGVPLRQTDGTVRGMLCVTDPHAVPELGARQYRSLELLAQVVTALLDDPQSKSMAQRRARVAAAIDGSGRQHVLQPIVDVRTGHAVGVEALARFDTEPYRPDLWFKEADAVGLLQPLEVAAAASGLAALAGREGYVSVNVSPGTIIAGGLDELLGQIEPRRVVIEITEHAAVTDYESLNAALVGHRAAGLRVAIDDAGAGHSSFRHILQLRPDYIKIDLSLVRDIQLDPARQALTASLLNFGRTIGATVIAEGVETQQELDTLARLGVCLMQGFFLGRPTTTPADAGFPTPSRHVVIDGNADLSLVLADAVRHTGNLEQLVRPLLDAVLSITGLETSYLTVRQGDQLEHRYVRNAGAIGLPDRFSLPWADSLCSSMHNQGLTWTNDARRDLADRPIAAAHDVATYVTTPLTDQHGTVLGTICAGSKNAVFISDAVVAQLQLIAHVISTELRKTTVR